LDKFGLINICDQSSQAFISSLRYGTRNIWWRIRASNGLIKAINIIEEELDLSSRKQ